MLREIVTALEALSEHTTLVLWIEDIQWADPATIDVLNSLGQRRDPAKLLLLATIRPSDPAAASASLRRAHADLLARPHSSQLQLQPLSSDEVTRYLDLQLGPELSLQTAAVMHQLTAGNPLFLVTVIEHLVRRGYFVDSRDGWQLQVPPEALAGAIPASLAGTVARELEELAGDERQAIDAASVVGTEFSLWLAAHAADMDELALEPVLEMLARRRTFIVRDGVVELANGIFSPVYRFTHGLYQEIVLEHTAPKRRADAHGRAGRALERVFVGREHEAAADLACHFHGAGDHLRAAQYLRVAAGNALKRYAPREAAALLHGAVTHAAHLPPDDRTRVELPLMLELGQAQLAAGETSLAIHTLTRLERRAADEGRHDDRLRALLTLAEAQVGIAREAALGCAHQIKVVSPFASDQTLASTAAIRAGIIELHFEGWSDEIADRCLEAWRDLPRQASDEHRTLAIRLLFVHTSRSAYSNAWSAGRRLLPQALASGNVADCAYCYYLLGVAALHLGRWDEAQAIAAEGAAVAERTGSTRYAVTLRLLQAWIALEARHFDDAYRMSKEERAIAESGGWANARQMSLLVGGAAALELGRLSEAAADLESLRDWYARERVLMDWLLGGAAPHLPGRTLPATRGSRARHDRSFGCPRGRHGHARTHLARARARDVRTRRDRTPRVRRGRPASPPGPARGARRQRPPGGVAYRGDDGNPARENRATRLGPPGAPEVRTGPRAAQSSGSPRPPRTRPPRNPASGCTDGERDSGIRRGPRSKAPNVLV